jgi:serine/threonine protein kinase
LCSGVNLKPANILVKADGTPKLVDFGIAKLLGGAAEPTLTAAGAMTPEYASPEQVRGAAITTASDVYSLGVLLYEMLTAERPYRKGRVR